MSGSVSEFVAMGGYAVYVWPAYGVALVVLGALIVSSLRTLRTREREVAALEAARPRRQRGRADPSGGSDGDDA